MFKIKNKVGTCSVNEELKKELGVELSGARTGELHTAHGIAKTPFFMPVSTKLTVKHISPMELIDEMDIQSMISNAYITSLRPGLDVIKEAGGVHKFMNYNRVLFTDSGGFQMLSPNFLKEINDKFVRFSDPFSQRILKMTPEDAIKVEREIGSDVAMCLDHVPAVKSDRGLAEESVRRTSLWAERCLKYHKACERKSHYGDKQLIFGIAQGALFKDLREQSAREIDAMDFDGNAIGGLCIGETKEEMFDALKWQMPHFSDSKPRYMMGVGSPEDIIRAVDMGVDIFDSIYPTQTARHCTVFTKNGMIKIDRGKFKYDLNPIDSQCDCYVCKNFTRSYLHHLSRSREWTHHRYLSYHNVYWITKFMEKIRESIDKGNFLEFKENFLNEYQSKKI